MKTAAQDCPSTDLSQTIHDYTVTDETCLGANDGTISVVFNDGNPPFAQYTLFEVGLGAIAFDFSGGNSVSFTGIPPGEYAIRIDHVSGCQSIVGFDATFKGLIVNPGPPMDENIVEAGNQALCAGDVQSVNIASSEVGTNYEILLDGANTGMITAGTGAALFLGNVTGLTPAGSPYVIQVESSRSSCTLIMTDQIDVTVDAIPTPSISGSGNVCEFDTGEVYSTTNNGHSYTWTVVGGSIVAGAGTNSITVDWGASGAGSVQVTEAIVASGCSATTPPFAVLIDPIPTPNISGDVDVCENETAVAYSTPAVGGNTYVWNVTGGAIASGAGTNSITVDWGGPGGGSVEVTESIIATGCTNVFNLPVTIHVQPTPVVSGTADVCEFDTGVVYSTPAVAGNTYSWTVVGGAIVSGIGTNSITVDWAGAGAGIVRVQESVPVAGCVTLSTDFAVTINPLPTPVITGPVMVCETATGVNYSTLLVGGNTYTWTISGGTITAGAGTNSITVDWGIAGPGSLTLLEVNPASGCQQTTLPLAVTIDPIPTPSITGATDVCAGETGVTYSTTDVPGNSYSWNVVGGVISGGAGTSSITVDWGAAGAGTVSVTEEITATGCQVTTPDLNVTIYLTPTPTVTGQASVCEFTTGVNYTTPNVAGNTYAWTVTGGTITSGDGTNSIMVDWGSAGAGTVSVQETVTAASCVVLSAPLPVSVDANPAPAVAGVVEVCENELGVIYSTPNVPGNNYLWTVVGGAIVSGAGTNSITVDWGAAGAGSIQVEETNPLTTCIFTTTPQAININSTPAPAIAGSADVCANQSGVVYTTPLVAGNNYNWNITGGTITSGLGTNSITVDWGSAGAGTLSVMESVITAGCDVTTPLFNITINSIPTPSITGTLTVCENETGVGYSTLAVAGNSYLWTVTGGTIVSGQNTDAIVVDWGSGPTGTVQVEETVTAAGCVTTTGVTNITIDPSTQNPPTTSSVTICLNDPIPTLTAVGTNIVWYDDAGLLPGNQVGTGPNFTPGPAQLDVSTLGTTTFFVTHDLGCGESPAAQVDINVVDLSPAPIVSSPLELCVNSAAPTLSTTGVGIIWYSDAGLSTQVGTGTNFTPGPSELDLTTPGTTSFFVTQNIGCNESPASELQVVVTAEPIAPGVAIPIVALCLGDAIPTLDATGSNLVWFDDMALTNQVATGGSFTPSAAQVDVNTVGKTTFYIAEVNICGNGPVATIDINVSDCSIPCFTHTSTVADADCNGQNGSITFNISGGVAPFTFTLSGPNGAVTQSSPDFQNLDVGTYGYLIEDANVCFAGGNIDIVSFNTTIDAQVSQIVGALCFEDNNGGSAVITVNGGADPYEYSMDGAVWTSFNSGDMLTNLPVGTNNIMFRNDLNDVCPDSESITIGKPANPLSAQVSTITESFTDEATGSILIDNISGGTGPYTVSAELVTPVFNNPQPDTSPLPASFDPQSQTTKILLENLYAGEYRITVEDDNQCQIVLNADVPFDDQLIFPNIFTPNDDGYNDTFFIRNLPDSQTSLMISSRWGRLIHEAKDYQNDWRADGVSEGIYYYTLVIAGREYTGWVEILRGE